MPRIALIPGDGIGNEVVPQARRVLQSVSDAQGLDLGFSEWDLGAERWLRDGVAVTEAELEALAGGHDAILLGALGDPRVPDGRHARQLLVALRTRLDLYVSFRPCVLLAPELCPLKRFKVPVRLEIFRDGTDGAHFGLGGALHRGTPQEVALDQGGHTREGVSRIVRAAFAFARDRGRPKVTLVDQAAAHPHAADLWRRVFAEVGEAFPEVERDAVAVEVVASDLVRRPERYAVLVTFGASGDVVGDLAAELTGGLGLAPVASIHPGRYGLFGPVQAPPPDAAGHGRVSPFGAVRCAGLLLDHLGHAAAGEQVERAVAAAIAAGKTTPDMGGSFSTEVVGAWLAERAAGGATEATGMRT